MAQRARKIQTGDTLIEGIRQKSVYLVLIAQDASSRSQKVIQDKCTTYKVDYVLWETKAVLSAAIGQVNRIAIGISDRGFAKSILESLK